VRGTTDPDAECCDRSSYPQHELVRFVLCEFVFSNLELGRGEPGIRPCILSGVSAPHFSCHFGLNVWVFQFHVSGFEFWVSGSEFKVQRFGFWVRDSGFSVQSKEGQGSKST
jgi:hypothetical protein